MAHNPEQDIAESKFLAFLEQDLMAQPNSIRPVTTRTFVEAERLTVGIKVNLDEALPENGDEPYI